MTKFAGKSSFRNKQSPKSEVSRARELALKVLLAVSSGSNAEEALNIELQAECLSPKDRGLITELVYGVLRWKTRLDSVIDRCLDKPKKKLNRKMRGILRIAVYQILLLDRVPDFAAVHEGVEQVRRWHGGHLSGFGNALLMKVVRERETVDPLPEPETKSLATYYSHPLWLVNRCWEDFGLESTTRLLKANNTRAPLIFRVNRIKISPDELFAYLHAHGIEAAPTFPRPNAFVVTGLRIPVFLIPGYKDGLFTVQESSSQLITPLLCAVSGQRILDACAAPGGKTSHLAALLQNRAEVIATDRNLDRMRETRKNLQRLGVTCVEFRVGDIMDGRFVQSLGTFDRILVDAPCSNLGVLRHNPELKYRITEENLAAFSQVQLRILKKVSLALRPGGKLVYSVCTMTKEETTDVMNAFLATSFGYAIAKVHGDEVSRQGFVGSDGFLRTFPSIEDKPVDGFFAARITKNCQVCE